MFESQLGETGSTIVQFALALVAVVALIFLVAWLAKRLSGGRFGHVHGDEASMQVLDTLHIDTKRKLVLVRQGKLEHLLLIGGGSDEVVERSMIGGIPLAARVQATKQQEKPNEEDTLARPAGRFRQTSRFSRSLSSKKDRALAEDATGSTKPPEDNPVSPGASDRLGSAGRTVASSTIANSVQEKPSPPMGETGPTSKAGEKDTSDPASPLTLKTGNKPDPSLSDQNDRLQKSLDQALSESLIDNDRISESPAPVTGPRREPTVSGNETKPAAAASVHDLDLERELEAALELDSFEAEPEATPPPVDLPPLPDLPTLPAVEPRKMDDAAPETGDQAPSVKAKESITPAPLDHRPGSVSTPEETGTTSPVASQEVDEAQSESAQPVVKDPMEPSPLIDPPQPKFPSGDRGISGKKPDETVKPSEDVPVELSGRSDPPISVPIPSRGPAANATTLAQPGKEDEPSVTPDERSDEALDISAMLHPNSPKPETGKTGSDTKTDADPLPDDLDDEMRLLLGEIAGEPDKK